MRTLEVDPATNDMVLGSDGNLSLIRGLDAIGQTSVQFARTRRGEMIHNIEGGIPFDLVAWAGAPNESQFEAVMRVRLSQVDGVLGVLAFEVRHTDDVLGYTATLQTTDGVVVTNG